MKKVVLALGSNIGDTLGNLKSAVSLLKEKGCAVKACSKLYKTEPWGYADQDDFLNGAILIETELKPFDLLDVTQGIEQEMGRKKLFVNGPRNIDVDILLYENETVESERLTIPHPRIAQRMFVLQPLMDIVPEWEMPDGKKVKELFEAYDGNERIEPTDLILKG